MRNKFVVIVFLLLFVACGGNELILQTDTGHGIGAYPMSYSENIAESRQLQNQVLSVLKHSSRSVDERYPDYFGGTYINGEGRVVMLVTDESKARRAMSSVNGNSDIIYLPCEHSYQTLLDVRSVLENYFKEKRDGLFDILAGFGIFTKENVVKVILTDCSTQKINEFRSTVIDSDCIEFVIGEKIKEQMDIISMVSPGSSVYTKIQEGRSYRGSIGFPVQERHGEKRVGMMSSGHLFMKEDTAYNNDDGFKPMGVCALSKNKGSVDAAFIVPVSNFFPSNYLMNMGMMVPVSANLSPETLEPTVGYRVSILGAKHFSLEDYGEVIDENYSCTNNKEIFYNLTLATYPSDDGDSGGLIYSTVGLKNLTVGINKGVVVVDGLDYSVYSKASVILDEFDLVRY